MISIKGLSKAFDTEEGALKILTHLNLEVAQGEAVAIVGPSGSGKSTLLGLMAGLDTPTSGSVEIEGVNITRLSVDDMAKFRGRRMGFVFQAFHLVPSLTALENVMLPLEISRHKQPEALALKALERAGLADRLTHRPLQLSGGEQQRVAIARALAPKPAILFVDEPTGSLDVHTGERIADLLFDVSREARITMVVVTHMPSLAERADRIYELVGGAIRLAKEAKKAK